MIAALIFQSTKFGLQICFSIAGQTFDFSLKFIFEGALLENMANRKGVFIGAYVPNELKESLRRRAALEHRTLSQEITRILVEAVHGKGLPVGSVDRRGNNSMPRRRSTDPLPRRRADDLPFISPEDKKK